MKFHRIISVQPFIQLGVNFVLFSFETVEIVLNLSLGPLLPSCPKSGFIFHIQAIHMICCFCNTMLLDKQTDF